MSFKRQKTHTSKHCLLIFDASKTDTAFFRLHHVLHVFIRNPRSRDEMFSAEIFCHTYDFHAIVSLKSARSVGQARGGASISHEHRPARTQDSLIGHVKTAREAGVGRCSCHTKTGPVWSDEAGPWLIWPVCHPPEQRQEMAHCATPGGVD